MRSRPDVPAGPKQLPSYGIIPKDFQMTHAFLTTTAVSIATRDMPLAERVDLRTDGLALARLMLRGLTAIQLAETLGCAPATVYNRIHAVYTPAQCQDLYKKAAVQAHHLKRETLAKAFLNHRNFPDMATSDPNLVRAFGSPEEVGRYVEIARRAGAISLPTVRPVQPLLAVG